MHVISHCERLLTAMLMNFNEICVLRELVARIISPFNEELNVEQILVD